MNPLLREHVTSGAFSLNLGKTHVAALVYMDAMITATQEEPNAHIDKSNGLQGELRATDRTWSFFVPGARGLMDRGLAIHTIPRDISWTFCDAWSITLAGRLVIELLKEAGIWQEYTNQLGPTVVIPQMGKRRRPLWPEEDTPVESVDS